MASSRFHGCVLCSRVCVAIAGLQARRSDQRRNLSSSPAGWRSQNTRQYFDATSLTAEQFRLSDALSLSAQSRHKTVQSVSKHARNRLCYRIVVKTSSLYIGLHACAKAYFPVSFAFTFAGSRKSLTYLVLTTCRSQENSTTRSSHGKYGRRRPLFDSNDRVNRRCGLLLKSWSLEGAVCCLGRVKK